MPNLASLARVQKIIPAILNAGPDDMSYVAATLTDQQKYSPDHITDAILYADFEVVRTRQETIGDGYRSQYGAVAAVANGAYIPAHPGRIGFIEIKKTSGDSFRRGIKVQSIDEINKLLDNPDGRYGSASIFGGRYHIDEELRLYFTGNSAQIFVPSDLAITSACQAPAIDEPRIARGAIMMLMKDPLDSNLFTTFSGLFQRDLMGIKNLEAVIPPQDTFVRQGG
jgi:hypothetical protein